jgi:hypothetical protein
VSTRCELQLSRAAHRVPELIFRNLKAILKKLPASGGSLVFAQGSLRSDFHANLNEFLDLFGERWPADGAEYLDGLNHHFDARTSKLAGWYASLSQHVGD